MLPRMAAPDSTPPVVVAEKPIEPVVACRTDVAVEVPAELLSGADVVLDEAEPHVSTPPPLLRADATEEVSADAIIEVASALGEAPAAQLVTEVMAPLPPPAPKPSAIAVAWAKGRAQARPFVRYGAVFAAVALLGLVSFGPLTLRLHPRHTLGSSTRADVVAARGLHEASVDGVAQPGPAPAAPVVAPSPEPVAAVASDVPMGPPPPPVAAVSVVAAPVAVAKVATPPRIAALPRSPKPAPKAPKASQAQAPKAVVSTPVAVAAPRAPRTNAPSALLRSTRDRHVYF
jgi:hypothetical protein